MKMLKRIDPNNIEELCSFLDGRMSDADPAILQRVSAILERVRNEGDEALFDYTKQFDQVEISELKVSEEEMAEALAKVDDSLLKDLQEAAENITAYHKLQLQEGYELKKRNGCLSRTTHHAAGTCGCLCAGRTCGISEHCFDECAAGQNSRCKGYRDGNAAG